MVISVRSSILWLSDSEHLCRGLLCCGRCVVIHVSGSFAPVPCQTAIQYAVSHAPGWSLAAVPCRRQSATPLVARGADGNLRGRMANLRRSAVNLRNVAANLRSRGVNLRNQSANLRRGLLKNPWKRAVRRIARWPKALQSSRFAIRCFLNNGGSSDRDCAGCGSDRAGYARYCASCTRTCAG